MVQILMKALFGKRVGVGFVTVYHNFPKKSTLKYSNFFTFYIIIIQINKYYKIKLFHFSIPLFHFSIPNILTFFFFFPHQSTSTTVSKPTLLPNTSEKSNVNLRTYFTPVNLTCFKCFFFLFFQSADMRSHLKHMSASVKWV
jgi:hypothetical protein